SPSTALAPDRRCRAPQGGLARRAPGRSLSGHRGDAPSSQAHRGRGPVAVRRASGGDRRDRWTGGEVPLLGRGPAGGRPAHPRRGAALGGGRLPDHSRRTLSALPLRGAAPPGAHPHLCQRRGDGAHGGVGRCSAGPARVAGVAGSRGTPPGAPSPLRWPTAALAHHAPLPASGVRLWGVPLRGAAGMSEPALRIDITAEVCPMTYVRTKLALERDGPGAQLEILLRGDEPLRNVPRSAREEGHQVVSFDPIGDGTWRLILRKHIPEPEGA